MAKLDGVFNANDVPERDDFTPVPPGMYTAMVVASELKDTKAGGQMIVLELDIQEGEHSGRKLFERLNIKNDNPKTVDIAFRALGEIVKSVGKTTIKDTEELHNKRIYVEVRVEPAKPYVDREGKEQTGSPQNSIKKYLPYTPTTKSSSSNGVEASPKAASSSSATVESSSDKATPPWKRKSV